MYFDYYCSHLKEIKKKKSSLSSNPVGEENKNWKSFS